MKLRERIERGEFIVTCEAAPPKGIAVEKALEEAQSVADYVHAFNVTDLQSSVMRMSSWAFCALLRGRGLEPILQLTCRDRNRLALQADLLGAWGLGIENVLALTGDHTTLGDHPEAMPVFDLDSVQLLDVIGKLNSGHDMVGNELDGATDFFPGAVVNPAADPLEPHIHKLHLKVSLGAKFFQTQAVYDPESYNVFAEKTAGIGVPILAGIIPLKSAKMARFMNDNIAGVHVPEEVIGELEAATSKEDRVKRSIDLCARTIQAVRPRCQGVHLMPMGWERHVPAILERAGL